MMAMVLPAHPTPGRRVTSDQRVQVVVNIHAEVLDPELARRKANGWLLENVGNLLGAENPELLLGDHLLWRYDVTLGRPNLEQPGSGDLFRIGQITLDAITGEIQHPTTLIELLQANAAAVIH